MRFRPAQNGLVLQAVEQSGLTTPIPLKLNATRVRWGFAFGETKTAEQTALASFPADRATIRQCG